MRPHPHIILKPTPYIFILELNIEKAGKLGKILENEFLIYCLVLTIF